MFYLVQAGSALQIVKSDGTIASTLALPTGVTVDATRRAKSAVLGSNVIIVNSPSQNLWLDPLTFVLRPMAILPPIGPPNAAAGASTGLTGAYQWKVSYGIKDDAGAIINESPLTPASLTVTLANQDGSLTNIPISPNTYVNCRRIYRTAAGGTIFFRVFDIDDNFTTAILDSVSDASTDRLPEEPTLGNPPGSMSGVRLKLLVTWKNYLWGVGDRFDLLDVLKYSEDNQFYAWGAANFFNIYPVGEDAFGITGFLARRDALGVLKRQLLTKVIGSSPADFEVKTVVDKVGCIAPESCTVIRDVGYWLAEDGVYKWSDDGVECITREKVDAWFTTDTYFNRSKFPDALGAYNPLTNAFELQLAAAGSTDLDRWISFHIDKQEWLGPHKTGAFTPTARALLRSDANALRPVIAGSDGYLYLQNQTTPSDVAAAANAIDAIVEPKWHHGKAPNVEHFFGALFLLTRIESAGQQMTITPYTGGLDAAAGVAMTSDLTLGRQRLGIIGTGRLARLQFRQNTVAQRFLLYGYEFPMHELGVR
jgi:hypothetical protein